MARQGIPLNVIQRQLGHANFSITSIHFQGIDPHTICPCGQVGYRSR